MKVTFVTIPPFLDVSVPLINAMADKIDVDVIINVHNEEKEAFLTGSSRLFRREKNNLKIHVIFWDNFKVLSFRNWSKIARLKRLMRGDVIHLQFFNVQYYFLVRFFSNAKQKLVFEIADVESHTGESRSLCGKFIFKNFIKYTDQIITRSFYSNDTLKRLYNVSSKSNVVPFGALNLVDNKTKLDIQEEPFTILFFGRISPYKGIEYLLEAIPAVKKEISNLKVILAGKGEYYFDIDKFRRNGSCEVINRYIPNEELASLIQRSAIIVCPYTDATQSGVVMTAYSFGKPVVATGVGGIPEVVEDGATGLLVPPGDSQKLAGALTYLLKNPDRAKKMSENIKNKFNQEGEFGWGVIVRKTVEVYEKAMSKPKLRG